MKKAILLSGLSGLVLSLSACGDLPEYKNLTNEARLGVTKANWIADESRVYSSDYDRIATKTLPATPEELIFSTPLPEPEVVYVAGQTAPPVDHAANHDMPQAGGLTQFDPTPVAVHANVAGTTPSLSYNGVNGVRPVLVNPGSVWSGPATYMLPVGTGNYAHQHLETVGTEYSHTVEPIVMSTKATALKRLFIRKSPSMSAEKCEVIPKGHSATLGTCEGDWCQVTYKGKIGWSARKYLSF